MPAEGVRKRDVQREATRVKVLEAAEQRFRDQGFAATTIRQIAEDASVSVGTVMATGDKDALLVAIFDGWISAIHAARTGDGQPVPGGDVTEDLFALFQPFVEYFASDEDLGRQYASIVVRGSHDTAIFHELGDALVAEITQALLASGQPAARADLAAQTIYLSYLGVLMRASNGAITAPEAMDRLREVITFTVGTP